MNEVAISDALQKMMFSCINKERVDEVEADLAQLLILVAWKAWNQCVTGNIEISDVSSVYERLRKDLEIDKKTIKKFFRYSGFEETFSAMIAYKQRYYLMDNRKIEAVESTERNTLKVYSTHVW